MTGASFVLEWILSEHDAQRREQIAANLAAVRERIAAAAARAGRAPSEITLVAVTKTYPAADVLHLAALGVADVGENRDQEAAPKAAEAAAAGVDLRWHFIGQLQRNKARSVASYAAMVHSVDSVRLAVALGAAAARAAGEARPGSLDALVQISVDGDPERGGALPTGDDPDRALLRVANAIAVHPALRLRGVMAVAPLDWAPERAFAEVARCAALIRAAHPDATVVSAGMSDDLDEAVACGATHVRIGSAILGMRPPLR
ncbi:YggS family pyridoxal phosphate-dependent enzyme [Catellatospora coxensis]|uniref:Pyridoxal phosphate homeostasis protein n=1 Tax=Catellatospora coxensis TaxID=310354 RepID=A0A8J3P4M9_9ACTN|nr:YggS family pyridoxal phosphate-dependent enzyme [Catellatospora coxensis]GIG03529.1 YggS family pyridoxal phosphate enzyme [Catellatospora coxensis]